MLSIIYYYSTTYYCHPGWVLMEVVLSIQGDATKGGGTDGRYKRRGS